MAKQNTSNSTKAIVGGSYRQVRRGTRDFGAMTENIKEAAVPGLTKLAEGKAFEKQLLKDYDTSKAKYEKSIDETIKGVGAISGSESISELKQKKAWNQNPNLQAKLRSELEVSAGQYAASTANKDAQGQNTIMKRNDGLTNTIGGVKAFVNAWSDPDVYHGEATNQTFENNEPGKPDLSMDYVAEMNNNNPDSIGFEEGTTVGGIDKMMMTIKDEEGNKRFIDMDAFNDPGTLAQSFKVRADLVADITTAQKAENYINPVYDEIKRSDYNDDESYNVAVSTKKINENTQNQYKDRTIAFSQNYVNSNQELLPSVYATMTASDWKPSSDTALPAGFTLEEYSALTKASTHYGKVSDLFMDNYRVRTNTERIKNKQEPLTKEQLNTKVQEAQDLMIQNYVEQQALADTPGYNLDADGNAALIGDLTAKSTTEQKASTSSSYGVGGGSGTIEELNQRYVKVNSKMNQAVDGINNAKGFWWKSGEPGQPTASVNLFNANVAKITDVLNTYTTGEGSAGINFENRATATTRFESSLDEDGLFVLKNGETLTKGETDDLKKNFDNPKNLIFEFSENGKLTSHAFGDEGPTVQALGEILRGKIPNQYKDEYDKVFYSGAIENRNLQENKEKVYTTLDDIMNNPNEYDEGEDARVSAFTSPNMTLAMQFEYLQRRGVSPNNSDNDPLFGSLSTAQQIKYLTSLKENVEKK